jgi:hypothetical protein
MTKPTETNRQREFYNNYYDDDLSQWRWIGAIAKADNIINISHDFPHAKILEVGAGDGAILKRLSDMYFGREYYALEVSMSSMAAIKKRDIKGLVACQIYDGSLLPYGDKEFDLVILSHVVEHLEYPRQLIYEAARVGGYVFVEVPLEDTIRLRQNIDNKIGHINFFSSLTIRCLLESCHLQVLNQTVCNLSKESFVFRYGKKGLVSYYIKKLALLAFPTIVTRIWTYHSALICRCLEINTE